MDLAMQMKHEVKRTRSYKAYSPVGKTKQGAAAVGQWVGCSPCMKEALGSIPSTTSPGVVTHACPTSIQETQAGGSGVLTYYQLHSKLESSLSCMNECLYGKRNEAEKEINK